MKRIIFIANSILVNPVIAMLGLVFLIIYPYVVLFDLDLSLKGVYRRNYHLLLYLYSKVFIWKQKGVSLGFYFESLKLWLFHRQFLPLLSMFLSVMISYKKFLSQFSNELQIRASCMKSSFVLACYSVWCLLTSKAQ